MYQRKIMNRKKKVFETKQRNPVKLDRTRKVWYLLLRVFWLLLPKFNFWKGNWAYVSTQIWDFPNISLFRKILSLKSFGNSWGNSYTKFAILDIMFRFTLIGSVLNIVKFQILWPRLHGYSQKGWGSSSGPPS